MSAAHVCHPCLRHDVKSRGQAQFLFASGKIRAVHFAVVYHITDLFRMMENPRITRPSRVSNKDAACRRDWTRPSCIARATHCASRVQHILPRISNTFYLACFQHILPRAFPTDFTSRVSNTTGRDGCSTRAGQPPHQLRRAARFQQDAGLNPICDSATPQVAATPSPASGGLTPPWSMTNSEGGE